MKGRGRRYKAWSVAIPIAGMVLSLWLAVSASAADFQAEPQESEPLAFEVGSYAKDVGVSSEEAERRLAIQHEGAGIVELLEEELGDGYAGIWFDNAAGEFVVPVVRSAARSAVAAKLEGTALKGHFRLESVRSTWSELEGAQKQLDRDLSNLIASSFVQTSRDPVHNSVVVHESESSSKSARAEIQEEIETQEVDVELRREAADRFRLGESACNEPVRVCDRPLRGGVKIEPLPVGSGYCTAGFKATGKTFGNQFILTAGHCSKGTGAWGSRDSSSALHEMAVAEESIFPGGDYGKLKVTGFGTYWEKGAWPSQVAFWGANQGNPINSESWSYVGQYVCHAGATSGSSCGSVTALGKTVAYEGGEVLVSLSEVAGPSFCAMPGDSGGPVFSSEIALGILSGAEVVPPGTCSPYALYQEVTNATNALGVTVGPRVAVPTTGPTTAFQANTSSLITMNLAGGTYWGQGMAPGTSPSIAGLAGGGYQVAIQANNSQLVAVGTAGNTNWGQGMAPGTSPGIAGLAGGGYQMAIQANNSQLVTIGSAGPTNWGQGMAAGTSPSIAALWVGGYEMAFQANNSQLITVGTAGNTNWGQGMAPGTSPSIAALSTGGYQMAFQNNGGELVTIGTAGPHNWGLKMMKGTSPSIALLSGGGFEVAFQSEAGYLWTVGAAGNSNWGLGMMAGTSPSIIGVPGVGGFGYQAAFQANNGELWTVGSLGATNWHQGMMNGTSPSIGG
jgi:hypothetical protein